MMKQVELPFGLKDGKLVEISEVERGINCCCICPSCQSPLVARKGKKKIHHFAHYKNPDCSSALETIFHLAAKEILNNSKYIRIPPVILYLNDKLDRRIELYHEQNLYFEKVYLEKSLGNIVPDILVEIEGAKIMIEIAVTHPIDDIKRNKIQDLGISTLEVDLKDFKDITSFKDLENELLTKTSNKSWIYNRKEASLRRKIEQYLHTLKVINSNGISIILDCPLRAQETNDIWPITNLYSICFQCEYLYRTIESETNDIIKIECLGHAKKEIAYLLSNYLNSPWEQLSLQLDFPKRSQPQVKPPSRRDH